MKYGVTIFPGNLWNRVVPYKGKKNVHLFQKPHSIYFFKKSNILYSLYVWEMGREYAQNLKTLTKKFLGITKNRIQ